MFSKDAFNSTALKTTAAMLGASLAFSACSSSEKQNSNISHVTEIIPNMTGFLNPHKNTECYNGGKRPCAVLIRTEPELSADYINANPDQHQVEWPLESYSGQSGDEVSVVCYGNGESVTSYEGGTTSSIWYKVLVPEQFVLNSAVISQINQHNSSVSTTNYQGSINAIGWASIEWFNEIKPISGIPECKVQ